MTKLYKLTTIPSIAAIFFLTFLISSSFAQETLEGVMRIKVSESLASHLEASDLSTNAKGEVVTGHAPIDHLNRQFRVKRFTRVFPHAGKHEAKHRRYGLHLWYELSADKDIPVSSMLQSYRSERQILKAEPVYRKAVIGTGKKDFGPRLINSKTLPSALPGSSNDPMLANQWHYNNTGQSGGTPGADIKLIDAWKTETGKSDVIIAVTDGGIQTDHVDLAANMWVNAGEIPGNNSDDDNNGYVDDIHGYSFVERKGKITAGSHATHVGGTIAAVTNNAVGVAGVAGGSNMNDGVRLMSCAVFLNDSAADGFAEAYVYSADNGAVISQNSWGYMLPDVYETVVLEAIDYFIAEAGKDENGNQTGPMKGGVVIFSAGNDNTDANYYPAFYEPVLAVASSTHRDMKAQYSNFGAWIDITAPGGETYQTGSHGVLSTLPGNQYGYFMGTSMACPHVSGVAGLVLSKFGGNGFTPEMLRERILRSVDEIDSLNASYARQLGSGRINAARALAQNQKIPPDAIADLYVAGKSVGEITLTWTSPADANDFASKYDLRYANSPITEANFSTAQIVADLPSPKPAGNKEDFTVKNLSGGKLFYFAIRSIDFEGNISPISNVVSEISALTPSIVVTPASLSKRLQTAGRSTLSFSIRNDGKGPLNFILQAPEKQNTFYTAEPMTGSVSATHEQIIAVTFDASGLLTGTYNEDIIIQHNDPDKSSVTVPITLHVTSNGSPIASVDHDTVDFRSAKIGVSVIRSVIVSNKGSDALVISQGTSNHPDFIADLTSPLSIEAFSSAAIRLIFTPSSKAVANGVVSLHTNDPSNPVLHIRVKGEGLEEPPVVVSPGFFNESLQQGSKITRTMMVKNNSAGERTYRLEVMNNRQVTLSASTSGGRLATSVDSADTRQRALLQKRQTAYAARQPQQKEMLETIGAPRAYVKPSNRTGRKSPASITEAKRYATGFEEFAAGPVAEQNGWYATNSWHISGVNPDRGELHLQGTGIPSGTGENYVLSPYLFEEYDYPRYTTTTMRINGDRAKGSSWEVVPQDPWSYIATRIRFNANGTIDALVIDNDYAFHWQRVPATKPSGYFELAIEYNNWGSDTSGFPTYHLFVNNRHVFSETGLASGIGQVAITTAMETSEPIFDVDEFEIFGGEYVPQFMTATPAEGVIPGGQSVSVDVAFDASVMKAGTYEADLLIHVDADTLVIPAALTVGDKIAPEGKILWEKWTDVPGIEIASIPVNTPPDSTRLLALFESPSNTGDNYGTRIHGYVEAPVSGYYTFWIASNDNGELWQGTDERVGTKRKIASVNGHTNPRQWDKYPTQRSAQIYLVANRRYYIEALHKESVGTDHVAVGWQLPDQSMERPITGMRLFPYNGDTFGQSPEVTIVSPKEGEIFSAPATIQLAVNAVDEDGEIVKVEFFNGEDKLAVDISAPYEFTWKDVAAGSYAMVIKATDNSGTTGMATVNISVSHGQACTEAGWIMREQWNNVPGDITSSIPLDEKPSLTETITSFESPLNIGDRYGTRIRGFLCVPISGKYTFWISGNDMSELWLSTNSSPSNKMKIAHVPGYTDVRQWTKYPSQRSTTVDLIAGQKYYIEALHKEGVGTDHVAVGWQLPDGTFERPIPGTRLLPFVPAGNELPIVQISSPNPGDTFVAPATVEVSAEASDVDGHIEKVEFFAMGKKLGEDSSAPYSLTWSNVPQGDHELTATAIDNSGGMAVSARVRLSVQAMCTASGNITREYWMQVPGDQVLNIPVNTLPDGVETLPAFEGPVNAGANYGARIRGYICPPQTGNYHFWIASNDHSELWLSTDSKPENSVKIASLTRATGPRQWDAFGSQRSQAIRLVQGKTYYIQALHKQGVGTDHVAVGWQLPDGTMERPIAGSRLSPFANAGGSLTERETARSMFPDNNAERGSLTLYPNPLRGEKLNIVVENLPVTEKHIREIEIRQLTGLPVFSRTIDCAGDCNSEIDITKNLPPGVYLVQVRIEGRVFTEKLLIP